MYLKSIEIKGFKSFADKIKLQFERGIGAIVGPNGSGKSNIADGVRWVLGEQSAKALRGNRMEDVIFSGTDGRKALGFAEVSIILDNSDNFLPIEYSEVAVTRRVFRSGESEYYLNKTGCRLKDINELFMDTGIGKEGYSIIGQGRIDEILSSRAEDRRRVFEEAAGIVKYKARKEDAERKLLRTEENLLRLGDIIEELQKRVGPLARQSELAKSYKSISAELKKLELSMFVKMIDRLDKGKKSTIDRFEDHRLDIDSKIKVKTRLETDISILENKIMQIEEELKNKQENVFKKLNLIETKKGEMNVLRQRIQSEKDNINLHGNELKSIEQDTERAENEKHSIGQSMQNLKEQLEDKNKTIDSFQTNLDHIELQTTKTEERVEALKVEIMKIRDYISEKNNKKNSLIIMNETAYKGKIRLLEEMDIVIARIEELKKESTAYKDKYNVLTEGLTKQSDLKKRLQEKARIHSAKRVELEQKQKKFGDSLNSDKSKLNLLIQMENEHEGYFGSVKALMAACGRDKILSKGIIGPVGELIGVKANLERAVETALGHSLQSIVTDTEGDAKRAIEHLKFNKLGRATFLPINAIKPRCLSNREEGALKMHGSIAPASALIDCSERVRNVIDNLLGRVVVVDSLDNGIKMAKAYGYAFKIVTVDGDVINAGGSITGGSSHRKATGLLQRKRDIKSLEKSIAEGEVSINKLDALSHALYAEEKSINHGLAETAKKCHDLELQRIRLNEMIGTKDKELLEKEAVKSRLETEKLKLERDYYKMQRDIEEIDETLREREIEAKEKQKKVDEFQGEDFKKKQNRENIRQQIMIHKVERAKTEQRLENMEEGFRKILLNIQKLQSSIFNRKERINENENNIKRLEKEICSLMQDIETLAIKTDNDNIEITGLGQLKTEIQQNLKEKEHGSKDVDQKIAELERVLHRDEMQLTKVDMELNSLHDRMWDDYEVTRIQALDYQYEIEDEKVARNRIKKLKSKLKDFGNINLNAIEEYSEVKERFDFLNLQRQDLEEAKHALNKIIKEMLDSMEGQFTKQFSIINHSFRNTFRELFGGGEAQVLLSDDDNVLESGIDIIAQPPGKKLQHLSLLSGGEKALTAIALLFAILSVKPSPFCILDEIESALDDSNVERFSTFLKKLSEDIQFVVITHRKGTIEIANNLYGVTMEEKGVSKLVSIKLEDMVS